MRRFAALKECPGKLTSLVNKVKHRFGRGYSVKIYSQEGEDAILARLFDGKAGGFYIDIGAHHPQRFSNSYFFYKKGWRGINIDAMPGSMALFNKLRPNDTNIEIAVAGGNRTRTYYMLDDPALNGFFDENNPINPVIRNRVVGSREITTVALGRLLEDVLPTPQEIDFMSIDVEGMEMEILDSNNWEKYRPKIILVEMRQSSIADVFESSLCRLLGEKRYDFLCKTPNTAFFCEREVPAQKILCD